VLYPADSYGCGHHRLIWPGQTLAAQGHDVVIADGKLTIEVTGDVVTDVTVPDGTDVIVLQRPTHRLLCQVPALLAERGVACVVDVDDDLSSIDPDNAAWLLVHPDMHRESLLRQGYRGPQLAAMVERLNAIQPVPHTWENLLRACRDATLVTVSTSGLLHRYARDGKPGRVLPNYLADHYYGHERRDSTMIGWPAVLHSHPHDPEIVGSALRRVLAENRSASFLGFGEDAIGVGKAFGLTADPPAAGKVSLLRWPDAVATIGVGIAPLADTTFNARKSHLKPLEMSACGVPWVASPRAEYKRLHDMGAGLLAGSAKQWHEQLTRLVRDAGLRAELSAAGRDVAEQLRLRDHADVYWEAWNDAYQIAQGTRKCAAAAELGNGSREDRHGDGQLSGSLSNASTRV
jgi:hypothetical protein